MIEAAIDTIAEVGFGRASLARIGERIGISKGLIGYHFAGKDDLIEQVVIEVLEQGKAYMRPRIVEAMETGSGFLRCLHRVQPRLHAGVPQLDGGRR